jgi:hypothetical protein
LDFLRLIQICNHSKRIAILVACLAHFSLFSQEAIQSTKENPQIIAFQRKPPERISAELVNCLENRNAKPYEHELLTKYGIVVLTAGQDEGTPTKSLLDSCSGPKSEWLQIPVMHDHGVYQVPTNEIIIKLKSGASDLAIERLRQKYKFLIVQSPTRRDPNRFTVSLLGTAAAKSVSVAGELAKLPDVEYAEVNFVVISYQQS